MKFQKIEFHIQHAENTFAHSCQVQHLHTIPTKHSEPQSNLTHPPSINHLSLAFGERRTLETLITPIQVINSQVFLNAAIH